MKALKLQSKSENVRGQGYQVALATVQPDSASQYHGARGACVVEILDGPEAGRIYDVVWWGGVQDSLMPDARGLRVCVSQPVVEQIRRFFERWCATAEVVLNA